MKAVLAGLTILLTSVFVTGCDPLDKEAVREITKKNDCEILAWGVVIESDIYRDDLDANSNRFFICKDGRVALVYQGTRKITIQFYNRIETKN